MLIDSHRLKAGDLEHWRSYSAVDAAFANMPGFARKVDRAMATIRTFANKPCYVSVSWGKDSVTTLDLALRAGFSGPVVWARWSPWDNPECEAVRDAFLNLYPGLDYHEVDKPDPDPTEASDDWKAVHEAFGARRITGIRAEESPARRLRCRHLGAITKQTCAPLSWWKVGDVFAYLRSRDLPVSACYAMTLGGRIPREQLRVDSLCGDRGAWFGRQEWERLYFGADIEKARR